MDSSHIPHSDSPHGAAASHGLQFDAATYVDQAAALVGLSLPASLRAGVIANFEHIQQIAQPVMEFSLPITVESAATFEP